MRLQADHRDGPERVCPVGRLWLRIGTDSVGNTRPTVNVLNVAASGTITLAVAAVLLVDIAWGHMLAIASAPSAATTEGGTQVTVSAGNAAATATSLQANGDRTPFEQSTSVDPEAMMTAREGPFRLP